jgi:hypothetical protein
MSNNVLVQDAWKYKEIPFVLFHQARVLFLESKLDEAEKIYEFLYNTIKPRIVFDGSDIYSHILYLNKKKCI